MARSFTRRDFLSGSLGVGAAGALHATLGPVGPVVRLGSGARTRAIATGATSGKPHKSAKVELTLVLCTLYGGNDGLNTVVPYESSAYRALRGQIAIAHDQALPLGKAGDIALGLNPVMVGLKALWDAGQVAIVLGVGYPNPNFSHFASMEIMQSADPSGDSTSGWVGRWLDASGSDPTRALSIGPNLPALFTGTAPAGVHARGLDDPGLAIARRRPSIHVRLLRARASLRPRARAGGCRRPGR